MTKKSFTSLFEFEDQVGLLHFDEIIARGIMPDACDGAFYSWMTKEIPKLCTGHSDLHIVSELENATVNYFDSSGIRFYLGDGDDNPDLVLERPKMTRERFQTTVDTILSIPETQRMGAHRFLLAWCTSILKGASVTDAKNTLRIAKWS